LAELTLCSCPLLALLLVLLRVLLVVATDRSVSETVRPLFALNQYIFSNTWLLRLLFSPSFPFINSIPDIPRGGGVAAGMRVNNPLMQSQRFQRGVVPSSPAASGAGEGEFSDAHGPDDSA